MVVAEEIVIRISGDTSDIDGDLKRLKGNLGGLRGGMKKLGAGLAKSGAVMSAAVTAPIIMIGKKIVDVVADYEAQMNLLEVASRSSGVGLDVLDAAVIKVGGDTDLMGISAAEAAEGVTNLFKAGLDATEIFGDLDGYIAGNTKLMGALRGAVDLAAASELNLDQTSELLAISLATFGLEASEAISVTDLYTKAADASVASVADLGAGMTAMGPVMKAFGWSIEDSATMLALLSEQGIAGAEAGTQVRSMMTNLMRPVDDVTEALDELNVELYDSQGRLQDMPHILGQLERAFDGLTEEQKLNYIQTLAGSRGQIAMNALLEQGTIGWKEMEKGIESAATAQQVAEARMQGFRGAMEQLNGVLETLMIKVGKPLLQEFLTPLIGKITEAASGALDSADSWGKWALGIAAVAAVIGPVLLILGAVVSALGMLLSPLGLVVAAVAFLALAWGLNWGGIRDKTFEIVEQLKPELEKVWEWLKVQGPKALKFLEDRWDAMWKGLAPAIDAATPLIKTAFKDIKALLEKELPGLIKNAGTAWDEMWKEFGEDLAKGIKDSEAQFAAAKENVKTLATAGAEALSAWETGLTAIAKALERIILAIEGVVGSLDIEIDLFKDGEFEGPDISSWIKEQKKEYRDFGYAATGITESTLDDIARRWDLGWREMKAAPAQAALVTVEQVGTMETGVGESMTRTAQDWDLNWRNMGTAATEQALVTVEQAGAMGLSFQQAAQDVALFPEAVNTIPPAVETAMVATTTGMTTGITTMRNAWVTGWNQMRADTWTATNSINSVVTSQMNRIKSIITSAMNAAKSAWVSAWNSMRSATASAVSSMVGTMSRLVSSLARVSSAARSAAGAVRGLAGAFSSAASAAGRAASAFAAAAAKMASIRPPSFLAPGSPSPFEETLINIDSLLTSISRGSLPEFGAAMGTAGGAGAIDRSNTTTNNLTLNVYTSASHEPIIADFMLLQSLAGGA